MSSRAGTDMARLRRLKRLAARYGVAVLVAERPSSRARGGYMLSEDETRKVLLGGDPAPYSATLDEIEAWLEAAIAEAE